MFSLYSKKEEWQFWKNLWLQLFFKSSHDFHSVSVVPQSADWQQQGTYLLLVAPVAPYSMDALNNRTFHNDLMCFWVAMEVLSLTPVHTRWGGKIFVLKQYWAAELTTSAEQGKTWRGYTNAAGTKGKTAICSGLGWAVWRPAGSGEVWKQVFPFPCLKIDPKEEILRRGIYTTVVRTRT